MQREIIQLTDFVVLIEQSVSTTDEFEKCSFEEAVIAFAFYGSGNVKLSIEYQQESYTFNNTAGLAFSFYGDKNVCFTHNISAKRPLQCITIITPIKNISQLPHLEKSFISSHFAWHTNPSTHFVTGPGFFMKHEMQYVVDKIFSNTYKGSTRSLFLQSQVTELLAHFFEMLSAENKLSLSINIKERDQLHQAKSIIESNLVTPPSIEGLSRQIGLNDFKLKKHFKELFGFSIYQYLQHVRLKKAHDLLKHSYLGIQETAWQVGYQSLSSFSSAFNKKFGYRPSDLKKSVSN